MVVAAVTVASLLIALPLSWAFAVLPFCYFIWQAIQRYYLLCSPAAVTGLLLKDSGCQLWRYGGKPLPVQLTRACRIGRYLLVLGLQEPSASRTIWVPVFCDQLETDEFRRLRVWLRFHPRSAG